MNVATVVVLVAALFPVALPAAPACNDAPAPNSIEADLLPTAPGSGKHTVSRDGAFTDDFLWGPGDRVKIGTRRQWGGSIVFFGLSAGAPGTNTIDANDTGREVQMALYDPDRKRQGCAHDASCRRKAAQRCPNSISFLGWNPVQGGNKCNVGSGVENVKAENGALSLAVSPLHWNPDWREVSCAADACARPDGRALKSDVQFRQRLRFVRDLVVELELEAVNLGAEARAPTVQEFPTLYTSYGARGTPNLNVLLASDGRLITIDKPANDGFFSKLFSSPGGWVTLQNAAQDYGVGLYAENRLQGWQGWQKAGLFNNVRARFSFGLAPHAAVHARAYLMLGSRATIANLARWLDTKLPPFGRLETPTQGETPTGSVLRVSGWTLDNTGVREVRVLLDGAQVAALAPDRERPDVCAAWPGYSGCVRAGFSGSIPVPQRNACGHLLEAVAVDDHGNARTIGRVSVAGVLQ